MCSCESSEDMKEILEKHSCESSEDIRYEGNFGVWSRRKRMTISIDVR